MPGGSWLIKLSLNPASAVLLKLLTLDGSHAASVPVLPRPTLAFGSCFDGGGKKTRRKAVESENQHCEIYLTTSFVPKAWMQLSKGVETS